MKTSLATLSTAFLLVGCLTNRNPDSIDLDLYFGVLSSNKFHDANLKQHYPKILRQFDEPLLVDSLNEYSLFRLIVIPAFTNPYCIVVKQQGDSIGVKYMVLPDKNPNLPFGVDNLTMTYHGGHKHLDSLFNDLQAAIFSNGYFSWHNNYDLTPCTDCTEYLFESLYQGRHKVVLRIDAPFERVYRDTGAFLGIVRATKAFVPECLLQDAEAARATEDLLFSVFRSDTL